MAVRASTLLLALGTLILSASQVAGSDAAARSSTCPPLSLPSGYADRVETALRAQQDVWGNELLSAPGGPTFAGASSYLEPLLLARAAKGRRLTTSGVYYVPFSGPVGREGAASMALHVADGSQILSQHVPRRSLTVSVGREGQERFGSCLSRLSTPRLGRGYLPILETRYVDHDGVRYRQESFATRIPQSGSLVSLVAVTADTGSSGPTTVRLTVSDAELVRHGSTLARDGKVVLVFSPGGSVVGSSVRYRVPAGAQRTVYAVFPSAPTVFREPARIDRATFASARSSVVRFWLRRLRTGTRIEVPEQRVANAYRALLVQDLALTWRYSVGNQYEEFSYPEGVDVAEVLSAQGFSRIARSMLITSLGTSSKRYPSWKMGQRLVGSALYYRLSRDRTYVDRATPTLRSYVAKLGSQISSNSRGILDRERYSSDIEDAVYGLHTQAIVWQGLRTMSQVWKATGYRVLAAEANALSERLEKGLRSAIVESQQRLPDGSLFVPTRLLDGEKPYDTVTESRSGGYWNLVAPYAFASGLFAPGGAQANGVIRYLLLHGSRLLGVVRAGAYSLYGLDARPPISGTNPVYGLNVARLLADNDRAAQLVLSLYGQLATAMAPGTFVSGEGLSVAPLAGDVYRSMYLPPNGASNASFLETLRLLLVHETRDRKLVPRGLELAFATPHAWLEPGNRIAVRRAPTSFGPVSFSITSRAGEISVSVDPPPRTPRVLRLRLRAPRGSRIAQIRLGGRPYGRFDARTGTIDLSRQTGHLTLVARIGGS